MAVLVKDPMLILAGNSTVLVGGYEPIKLKWLNAVCTLQGGVGNGLLLSLLWKGNPFYFSFSDKGM